MSKATPRQLELLRLIQKYMAAHSMAPSRAELRTALNVSRTNSVSCLLRNMEANGLLLLRSHVHRGIQITELGQTLAAEPTEVAEEVPRE